MTRWAAQGVSTCHHTQTSHLWWAGAAPSSSTRCWVRGTLGRGARCGNAPQTLRASCSPTPWSQPVQPRPRGPTPFPACLWLPPAHGMNPGRTQDRAQPPVAKQRQAPPTRLWPLAPGQPCCRHAWETAREDARSHADGPGKRRQWRASPSGLYPRGASVGTPHNRASLRGSRPQTSTLHAVRPRLSFNATCSPSKLSAACIPTCRVAACPSPRPCVGSTSPRRPARSTSGQLSTEDGRWVPAAGGPKPRSPPLCHSPGPRPWGFRSCLGGAPDPQAGATASAGAGGPPMPVEDRRQGTGAMPCLCGLTPQPRPCLDKAPGPGLLPSPSTGEQPPWGRTWSLVGSLSGTCSPDSRRCAGQNGHLRPEPHAALLGSRACPSRRGQEVISSTR